MKLLKSSRSSAAAAVDSSATKNTTTQDNHQQEQQKGLLSMFRKMKQKKSKKAASKKNNSKQKPAAALPEQAPPIPAQQKTQPRQPKRPSRRRHTKNNKNSNNWSDEMTASLSEQFDQFSLYSGESLQVPEIPWVPTPEAEDITPQKYLDRLLAARNYETERFDCLHTAYFNKPTPLQLASYHRHLVTLVKANRVEELTDILEGGLSPNPRNTFGSSLLHLVCRRGCVSVFDVMMKNGCSIQVADEFGRTPLHDACFGQSTTTGTSGGKRGPNFVMIGKILQADPFLVHLADQRGHAPLDYVQPKDYAAWMDFLDTHVDEYWPVRPANVVAVPNPLTLQQANTRPLPDPPQALSTSLAQAVACGEMRPAEARILNSGTLEGLFDDDDDSDDDEDSELDDDEDSEDDSSCASDEDDDLLSELQAMSQYHHNQ